MFLLEELYNKIIPDNNKLYKKRNKNDSKKKKSASAL